MKMNAKKIVIILGVLLLLVVTVSTVPPTIVGPTPNSGMNNTLVLVNNLAGTDFPDQNNVSVYLNQSGQPDFYADNVLVDSNSQIQFILNLTQKPHFGAWNVVVKNTSSLETGVGIDNFTVTNPAPLLFGINPVNGTNNLTAMPFTVTGNNFIPGAVINLTRPSYSNKTASITSYGNRFTIRDTRI